MALVPGLMAVTFHVAARANILPGDFVPRLE